MVGVRITVGTEFFNLKTLILCIGTDFSRVVPLRTLFARQNGFDFFSFIFRLTHNDGYYRSIYILLQISILLDLEVFILVCLIPAL